MKRPARGLVLYVIVLRLVKDAQRTRAELSELLGMHDDAMVEILRQLYYLNLVHPHFEPWHDPQAVRGGWDIYWRIGAAPKPRQPHPINKCHPLKPRHMLASMGRALDVLMRRRSATAMDIGKAMNPGKYRPSVVKTLLDAMLEHRLIYISGYRQPKIGGDPIRRFTLGWDRKDVPRPPKKDIRITKRDYQRRRAAEQRAERQHRAENLRSTLAGSEERSQQLHVLFALAGNAKAFQQRA